MRRLWMWPFTILGVLTITLFFVAEAIQRGGSTVEPLYRVLRALIVPIWLMRYVVVAIGGALFGFGPANGIPIWYDILTIPILLLPYVAADLLLTGGWRWVRSRKPGAP